MFAQAMLFATAPLLLVNADIPSRDYVDARAEAELPWEINKTGG